MMKIFKKISIYLVIIISVMFVRMLNVYAVDGVSENNVDVTTTTSVLDYDYDSYDYVIDKYDVNIIVNENNTFDITETITVNFNESKHGINRIIPLINRIERKNGTRTTNRVLIDNVMVNHEFNARKENGNYVIQIGSSDKTLFGKETYIIKYTYNIGKDPIENYDEVYFDIIGDGWDTVINNVTFKVSMPKKFDSKKLEFLSGDELLTNDKIKYNIENNIIEGNYNGVLYESLTIDLKLSENYFKGDFLNLSIYTYLMIIIPAACLLIAFVLWYLFSHNKKVVESVGFYPPEGYNSLEVGFLYKGYADKKDVTSLLIYLANKGYLKISEIEEKALFLKKKGFKITKLKDYDGDNLYERVFLNGLFKNNDEVTSSDLQGSFYATTSQILSDINSDENKDKIVKKNTILKVILIVLFCVSSFATLVLPIFEYTNSVIILKVILTYVVIIPFIIITFVSKLKLISRFIVSILILGITQLYLELDGVMTVIKLFDVNFIYILGMMIGIVSILFISYLFKQKQRTNFGNEILYKIKGFKNYLVTAEKERLEDNVKKDPEYFYNILPYTYVLNISNKWIKKFQTISMQNPSWCDTMNSLDFINDTFNTTYSMVSYSGSLGGGADSSSGGSSSGGSSSGGSGGGGGSSW